mgnify:CR=1 FL=1
MVLDPSAYIAGLNRAAQHTANFQSSIQAGTAGINAFGKASQSMAVGMSRLNSSVYASMTAFYALSRVVSSSLGVFEEYNNIISRISATADLSINSVTALSESFKKLNRELGGSRTDLMKGVYRAVQANFTTPGEFMPIGAAAMRLRTASGREIDTTKSADVISVIRNALGIKSGREGFITDMLLRGRDIGRYELTEMASALGIPITLFGNQFSAKLGPEETLRQLIAILSSATQTGLNPRTAATGTRRMVEKTTRLMKSPEGIGKNLTTALRSMGFSSISEALNQGPMAFLETISRLTGGSPEALTQMGYGSRDIMLLTSALRNNMGQTREFYGKLAPDEIGGTTDKYLDRHKQTWWHQRDRLRSAYLDSQLKFMEAMIPVLTVFANSLEKINDLFQALGEPIQRLIGLLTIGMGAKILGNFFIRGSTGRGLGAQGSTNLMKNLPVMGAGTPRTADYYNPLRRIIVPNKYVKPVKAPLGNQIYGVKNSVFKTVFPSYYGGGISPVGGFSVIGKRSAQLQTIPASQIMGPTGPLFPQRYNRRATDGRFVPRGYDIRDWRGGIVPPSKMGSPVQQGGLGRRGAMYDSASRFFLRASDNMQRFSEGYGKAKGWLKDSWLGRKRNQQRMFMPMPSPIRQGYLELHHKRMTSMWGPPKQKPSMLVKGGKWAAGAAGPSLGWAGGMHLGSKLEGENGSGLLPMALSMMGMQAGSKIAAGLAVKGGLGTMLGNAASFASASALPLTAAYMGYKVIPGLVKYKDKDSSWGSLDEYGDKMLMRKRSKGAVGRFFENMSRSLSDVAPMSIRGLLGGNMKAMRGARVRSNAIWKNPSMEDIWNFGANRLDSTSLEYMQKHKISSVSDLFANKDFNKSYKEEFGTDTQKLRTGLHMSNPNEWLDLVQDGLKQVAITEKLAKATQELTIAREKELYAVEGMRERFSSYKAGTQMIENRGELFDMQAHRNMSPSDVQMWNSEKYREMMKKASAELPQGSIYPEEILPFKRTGDRLLDHAEKLRVLEEKRRYETTGDSLTPEEREKNKGYGKYGDAANDFFKAVEDERRIGQLAKLLPMLSSMDPASATKALRNIYGDDLRLDEKGIDYLRNIDMSRFFSVKPYDQLGDRPQFATVGSVEGYNSMIEMTTPEIEELQLIGEAIKKLNEDISANNKEERREFEDMFQKHVEQYLSTIADNTGKMAGTVPPSNEVPDYNTY